LRQSFLGQSFVAFIRRWLESRRRPGEVEALAGAAADVLLGHFGGAELVFERHGARGPGLGARFLGSEAFAEFLGAPGEGEAFFGDVFAVDVRLDLVGTVLGPSGEIGEALESEEIGGSVVARRGEVVSGVHNGVVHFVGDAVIGSWFSVVGRGRRLGRSEKEIAGRQGVELGDGHFFVCGYARIDEVEQSDFGVECLERAYGYFG
jgi:hypothetical protein